MALVALLVIALVCLAVGLVLPSVAWLIASLIATAGAGFLLVKARSTILAPHTAGLGTDAPHAVQDADATSVLPRVDPTGGVDGSPAMDAPVDAPGQTGETGDAAVDSDQVRSEVTEAAYAAGPDDVWVIDGRPRYHVRTCVIIQGQDAEPIPFSQAVEDGFMPCSLCEPQLARAVASDS